MAVSCALLKLNWRDWIIRHHLVALALQHFSFLSHGVIVVHSNPLSGSFCGMTSLVPHESSCSKLNCEIRLTFS
jgi:hypothetical protein